MQAKPKYSVSEEVANSITHGIGAIFGIVALAVMVALSYRYGDIWHLISCSIYGGALILLFSASTLYHSVWHEKTKQILQRVDHSAIYILIAGTYTPFTLVNLRGTWGWSLFAGVWLLALLGLALQFTSWRKFKSLRVGLSVAMGWAVLIAAKPLWENVESGGLLLLLFGGLAYTLGIVFYLWRSMKFHHAIWHLFVLLGSAFHFVAVCRYVVLAP